MARMLWSTILLRLTHIPSYQAKRRFRAMRYARPRFQTWQVVQVAKYETLSRLLPLRPGSVDLPRQCGSIFAHWASVSTKRSIRSLKHIQA